MKRKHGKVMKLSVTLLTTALVGSCGKSDDDGESSADSLQELGLSSALNLSVPDSVLGSDTSLRVLSSHKAREACELRNMIREQMQRLSEVSVTFCHLEAESEKMEFGNKYKVAMGRGRELGIFVDNSDAAALRVTMCMNDERNSYFEIKSAKDGAAKGTLINRGSFNAGGTTSSHAFSSAFDNGYTESGRVKVLSKSKFTFGDDAFSSQVSLDLNEAGVSVVKGSRAGTFGGNDFTTTGAAKVNSDYGMSILKLESAGNKNEAFTNIAYFDSAGYVVTENDSADFASGGVLHVAKTEVPPPLASTFEPDAFPAEAWDCSGATELTGVDPSSAAHQSCDEAIKVDWNETENCDDPDTYETGEPTDDFDPNQNQELDPNDIVEE